MTKVIVLYAGKLFNTDCWFSLLVYLFVLEILKNKEALRKK